jgi:hypothetical protein
VRDAAAVGRVEALRALRDEKKFPPGFEDCHPRPVHIIRWLLQARTRPTLPRSRVARSPLPLTRCVGDVGGAQDDAAKRPVAGEVLKSPLLPPKMEDDYMKVSGGASARHGAAAEMVTDAPSTAGRCPDASAPAQHVL